MDSKKGELDFLSVEDFEALTGEQQSNTFKVGEVLEIKDSRFRVQKIERKRMILKILKPNE